MKKAAVLFSLLFCFVLTTNNVNAQATKSKFDLWPELKTFHGVMSETFHPSEEGDLAPIKERSVEMESKALALSNSKIPADFNFGTVPGLSNEVQAKLNRVRPETLGHAGRIPGVTPAAVAILDVYLSIRRSAQ